jgi:hypothetical protein
LPPPPFCPFLLPSEFNQFRYRYLRSYRAILSDAGYVQDKPSICNRAISFLLSLRSPSHLSTGTAALKIRRLKCVYLLSALLTSLAITGYLLSVSVQGHLDLVLQSRQVPAQAGLKPPMFGVCHTFLNIDQFNIVDSQTNLPLSYEFENFAEELGTFNPIYFTNQSTHALPFQYSPSSGNGPSCFYHNLLPRLLGPNTDRLKQFVSVVIRGETDGGAAFDEYIKRGLWRNCAVCYAPIGITQSLNMRFDLSIPEEKPSSSRDVPDNIYNFERLKQTFGNPQVSQGAYAFWMQLNCSNTAKCGKEESYPYDCCMRHMYDAASPSLFNILSADVMDVPSSTLPSPHSHYCDT